MMKLYIFEIKFIRIVILNLNLCELPMFQIKLFQSIVKIFVGKKVSDFLIIDELGVDEYFFIYSTFINAPIILSGKFFIVKFK